MESQKNAKERALRALPQTTETVAGGKRTYPHLVVSRTVYTCQTSKGNGRFPRLAEDIDERKQRNP